MATRERAIDRGSARGEWLLRLIGTEIRLARRNLGLSLRAVAAEVGISKTELARIERGLAPWVSLVVLAKVCAVVGLDLSARAYPGGTPLRDARHTRLLAKLRARLHASLRWMSEVPMPDERDQRSWDGVIVGPGWWYGVEAELNPFDGQATLRRIGAKLRDSNAAGVILLMPDTRQTRIFRREFVSLLAADYPMPARVALARLAAGEQPGGSAIVIL
jgi:transcriptional regulator with XRE-family HTH domain